MKIQMWASDRRQKVPASWMVINSRTGIKYIFPNEGAISVDIVSGDTLEVWLTKPGYYTIHTFIKPPYMGDGYQFGLKRRFVPVTGMSCYRRNTYAAGMQGLGETETEKQERLYNEGLIQEVVATGSNAGQNANAGYKNEVIALMKPKPYTVGNIVGGVAFAGGTYFTIAGIVNLFRKRYAGHRLRYAGGYMALGVLAHGVGYYLNQERINQALERTKVY